MSPMDGRWSFACAVLGAALVLGGCGGGGERGGSGGRLVLVSGGDQVGTVGTPLPHPVVVRLFDGQGRGAAGQTISVQASGGGTVSPGGIVTGADGTGSVTWRLGTVATTQWLIFASTEPGTGAAVPSPPVEATAAPGPPAVIHFDPDLSYSWPSWPDPASMTSVVVDAYGNPVSGAEVTFTASSGGTVSPTSAVTDGSGTAVTTWTFAEVPEEQTFQASVGTVTGTVARVVAMADLVEGTYVGTLVEGTSSGTLPGTCGGSVDIRVENRQVSSSLGYATLDPNGCFSGADHYLFYWKRFGGCLKLDGAGGASGSGSVSVTEVQNTCQGTWTATRQPTSGDGQTGVAGTTLP